MDFDRVLLSYLDQNNISNLKDLLNFLDYSYDGIALSDKKGLVFYVNHALERITGVDRNYLIGKTPKDYKKDGLVLKAIKRKMKDNVINVIQLSRTGNVFLITTVPVYFKNDMFYFSNYREINELNNLQVELLAELEKKSEFGFSDQLKGVVKVFSNNEIIIKSHSMNKIMKIINKLGNQVWVRMCLLSLYIT